MMLTEGVSRPTPASSSESAALLDRLEIWDTPSLIALVLGLLALIWIGVTALRITLCVWGSATFIAFIFIGNVI